MSHEYPWDIAWNTLISLTCGILKMHHGIMSWIGFFTMVGSIASRENNTHRLFCDISIDPTWYCMYHARSRGISHGILLLHTRNIHEVPHTECTPWYNRDSVYGVSHAVNNVYTVQDRIEYPIL